jgi:nucleoid DNA-binding protein
MKHKDFVTAMCKKTDLSKSDLAEYLEAFQQELAEILMEGDTLAIPNFGTFEAKKKLERVVVHPVTQVKMLVPPKYVVSFKPIGLFKEKLK